jgi:hypothetical protein
MRWRTVSYWMRVEPGQCQKQFYRTDFTNEFARRKIKIYWAYNHSNLQLKANGRGDNAYQVMRQPKQGVQERAHEGQETMHYVSQASGHT